MSIEPIRRQSIVSLIWQIAFTLIGFLSTMYFARAVGAGVLGAYFLFVAYFSIIGLMTDGGFGVAAIKRISEGEEPEGPGKHYFIHRFNVYHIELTGQVVGGRCPPQAL